MSDQQQSQNEGSEAEVDQPQAVGEDKIEEQAGQAAEQPAETAAEVGMDDLLRQLDVANRKAEEHWEKLMRAKAEIDNLRKRHERDLESAHKFGIEGFSKELLQVRDSLELGHQAAQDEQVELESLRQGTELTLKLLNDVMQKFGVEQIDPVGEAFNPEMHQAMSMMPSPDHAPNTVVQVVQKGYLLNGRLLRPAMVIVSAAA